MFVSVVIPVYDVASYIEVCLRSVVSQSMTQGVECIIVDDCGHDCSIQIAEEFIRQYHGAVDFRVIRHEHNGGLSAARNTGIRQAKGEYLYFLDSDDYITSDCIQSLWSMVERHPGVDCVFAGANVIGANLHSWLDYTQKQLPEYSNDRDWLQESMLKRYLLGMTAWNRLISTSFVRQHQLFFEEGYIHEDELWNLLISQHIQSAAFLKANTYNYIQRTDSITNIVSGNVKLFMERRFRLLNKMLNLVGGYRKEIQSIAIASVAGDCLSKISTFEEYRKLMAIIVRAILKSEMPYSGRLIRMLLGWNKYLIRKLIA